LKYTTGISIKNIIFIKNERKITGLVKQILQECGSVDDCVNLL